MLGDLVSSHLSYKSKKSAAVNNAFHGQCALGLYGEYAVENNAGDFWGVMLARMDEVKSDIKKQD